MYTYKHGLVKYSQTLSNYTDTKGAIQNGFHIKRGEFREKVQL